MSRPVVTQHMALCDAIVATLTVAPKLADGEVVSYRRRSMPPNVNRRVYVYLEDSTNDRGAIKGAPMDWRTRIRIECVARDIPGVMSEVVADALLAQVYARIMADTTLGNLALDVFPEAVAWTGDEADTTLTAAQMILTILHVTYEGVIASA